MEKIIKITLSTLILISIASVSANASAIKGQKLYLKKLKYVCGMNGGAMASKYSTAQWEAINAKGEISQEIKRICPKVKDSALKEGFIPHYFDFFKEYSNDSGNIPAC